MKIEDLVLSLDQMNHLKELGLEVKDTALCIIPRESGHKCYVPTEVVFPQDEDIKIPTLTLQEILEMLPKEVKFKEERYFLRMLSSRRFLYTNQFNGCVFDAISENILQAAYNMLCWLAENGYLKNQ